MLSLRVALLLVLAARLLAAETPFREQLQPLLDQYCLACHGPAIAQSDFRVDTLPADIGATRKNTELWARVASKLRRNDMPPRGAPQPERAQREEAVALLRAVIQPILEARRSTDGRPLLRRLNRVEYQNTMTDLFGYEMDYARDIPPDSLSRDGFRNNGSALRMTAIQLEYYLEAARKALDRVIVEGGRPETFYFEFEESNQTRWKISEEAIARNVVGRTDAFLGLMEACYPEEGRFRVQVAAAAELEPGKGPPVMQVSVGFRPDTEIVFRTLGTFELTSEQPRTFELYGLMENFPKPVPGQSKFPGLLVRITNVYDDGKPRPKVKTRKDEEGKRIQYYDEEPDFPKVRVESVVFEGPVYEQWPPEHHTRILFDSPLRQADETAYVREVLDRFLTRAWRRPAEPGEVERFVAFFEGQREAYPVFEHRIRETLAMALISPEFLYLLEPNSEQKRPLDGWELASRLSYTLWSAMPDERLFALAAEGELGESGTLGGEVDRMLADERAWRFIDQFVGQWLYLEGMDRVAISKDYYPAYRPSLEQSVREETRQFVMELFRNNLSAANLIDSDFLVLNETMARHYEIEGVRGSRFRRVRLPEGSPRGGLLTQGSVLLANSTGEDSHPIKRAVWVRKRLLDDPPPPPPPNVPELDTEDPELARLTVRQQLAAHRNDAGCASCHVDIDPWGLALEHFDAIGQWRTEIRRMRRSEEQPTEAEGSDEDEDEEPPQPEFDLLPVETRETLPDGTEIHGVDDLRAYLLGPRREDFARTVVKRLLAYSLNRSLELSDEQVVERLTQDFLADEMKLRNLLERVVTSELFQTK